ncbi:TonB-dependent receptor [Candidatus Aerophobetes bacterium]|uniref:TonB-dependent receptor n=1 Tax=Aerophobetes bacterium TaxID=2030807 RepID=A0A523YNN2_UNCAE|nr:MAG: TonB-dependent receptor [Candidatus Aerophobetes bacterium]
MSTFFKRAFSFAVCLFFVSSLFAVQTGEIIGKVTDDTGAPLPGVAITAKSPRLQGIRTAVSAGNGNFRFPLLPIGKYSLTFELSGFEKITQTGYDIHLGFTVSIDVALKIATVTEEIIVTAETPLIDKTRTDTSYRLSAEDLARAPTQGRTIQEIVSYTPGVTGVRADTVYGTGTGSPSFRGEGEEGNNWLVDGLSARGAIHNDSGVTINYDSWDEVQIISDPFMPDLGHSQGGIINIVTKSGGNEFHGELGALIRDQHLRAERKDQLSVVSEPNTSIHNYFGNLGGPIIKDKLWFFLSNNFHRTADDSDVETIGWLTFPSGKRRLNTNNLFGKITFTPQKGHSFSFSGTLDKFLSQSGGIGLTETYTKTAYTDYSYRINYRGIINQNTLLEAAFGQSDRDSGIKLIEEDFGPARYYWSDIGQYTNNAMADRVTIERRTDFNTRLTQYFDLGRFGNHEIGAGFSYYRTYSEDDVRWTGQDFDLWTGNGFDNGVEITWSSPGNPSLLREYGNYGVVDSTKGISLYLKDRITIDRFAFMLGLRTETQRIFNDMGDEVWSWGLGDFLSPRASLAVDLLNDGNNILKFSFGQFTNPVTTKVLEFFNTEAGYNWRLYSWAGGSDPTDAQLQDPANWSFQYAQTQTSYGVDPDLKPNKTTKFLLEFDRQLGRNWALKLRGVYSYARDITELVGVYDPVNVWAWVFKNFKFKKRDYRAIEVELNGRIADRLMLNASYTWSEAKGTNPGQFELGFWDGTAGNAYEAGVFGDRMKLPDGHAYKDLTDLIFGGLGGEDYGDEGWYGFLPYSVDHQVKILGTYFAPYDFIISAYIEYLSGYHWEKKGYSAGYGDYYLFPEGRGGRTTPGHMYVDLSLEKDFALPQGFILSLRLNVFNILNSQRSISFVKADTALFGEVWGRQEPRWLQLQAILRF